ncbi:G0/G1 switch protein 2 [Chiloscyllium plagiosum]|uniref:G0/G1 switch protein 2 n=1 Tax=Chiloscyllium plagiosum TaxID=36176 RepID=UPI001CB861EC|nr:G0/G1 switch protein 2 [Chiloscyllium plagiosum]
MSSIKVDQPVEYCIFQSTDIRKIIQAGTTMETMNELIPFAREMLSQKPNRKMVKLYVVGSVLAFFGVVIGLVETVCSPLVSGEDEKQPLDGALPRKLSKEEKKLQAAQRQQVRTGSYRKHAS